MSITPNLFNSNCSSFDAFLIHGSVFSLSGGILYTGSDDAGENILAALMSTVSQQITAEFKIDVSAVTDEIVVVLGLITYQVMIKLRPEGVGYVYMDGETPNTAMIEAPLISANTTYRIQANEATGKFEFFINGVSKGANFTLNLPNGFGSPLVAMQAPAGSVGHVTSIKSGDGLGDFAEAITYTVAYNSNGGSGTITDASSPYASGASVTVKPVTGFTYTGKSFVKWNTAADGSGTDYDPADTFNIATNTTLYAQWQTVTGKKTRVGRIFDIKHGSSNRGTKVLPIN